MKLKFKSYGFQTDAVNAVVDLFAGQERRQDTFTITNEQQLSIDGGTGVRNVLTLTDEQIVRNMNNLQKRFSLPLTGDVDGGAAPAFCVEMETGTGKTYVYTKTIFELHKQYGFTKFIVVVPSVAIREGVHKSFEITADHFAAAYDNAPCRCFIYESKKLSTVRLFATSSDIEIMIINIDAFKKSENVINQEHDKLSGAAAINLIQATNPIVIIDEPQSVDNTPKAKEAIASLNPLCVLRYSATHREKINLLYRLTPVDAYQMGLVKQICVSSNQVESDFNRPYIRLMSVSMDNGFSAKVEIDKTLKGGVARKIVTVKQGADFYELSGERDLYKGYSLAGIDCQPGFESIEFTDGQVLPLGKAWGDIDENVIKRAQIRRTIEAHFEKELRYFDKGIKVLSLFFVDEVGKYRTAEGEKGIYAEMFEECYTELLAKEKFAALRELFGLDATSRCHDGYFSQDKRGVYKNTNGETLDDYSTYDTIMRDKEWLLSFDCPLRFIFSHSALKEGWDNPNVFQVCTLIEQKSTFTARQKVGRGLRLCVNQDGERIEDRNINILHVMANESFAEFAENLQKEIESETGVKFGVLQLSLFSGVTYTETVTEEKRVDSAVAAQIVEYVKQHVEAITAPETAKIDGEVVPLVFKPLPDVPADVPAALVEKVVEAVKLGASAAAITPEQVAAITYTETKQVEQTVSYDDAQELLTHFERKGYVTKSGTIKDTMKAALAAGTLDLPAKFEAAREKFETVISKANTKPIVHDASKEVRVKLKKQVLISPEFLALWDKIKGRTAYRVQIDEEQLKERCIMQLQLMEAVPKARIVTRAANINVENAGVSGFETSVRATDLADEGHKLPEFLRAVDNECFLSQRTVVDILVKSGRHGDFLNNPQKLTEMFIAIVKQVQNTMEIDGIRYLRLDGEEYYLQEIFDAEELTAYLDKNAVAVQNSVYDHVLYDSDTVERPFAVALDDDPDVRMFFKIPPGFKIETPIGTYNPDWAVYLDKDGEERLYFVLETKGVSGQIGLNELPGQQKQKIHCGEEHFRALDSGVRFSGQPVRNWGEVKVGI